MFCFCLLVYYFRVAGSLTGVTYPGQGELRKKHQLRGGSNLLILPDVVYRHINYIVAETLCKGRNTYDIYLPQIYPS